MADDDTQTWTPPEVAKTWQPPEVAKSSVVAAASQPGMAEHPALAPLDEEKRFKVLNQTIIGAKSGADVGSNWPAVKKGYMSLVGPVKAGEVGDKELHKILSDQYMATEGKEAEDSYKSEWAKFVLTHKAEPEGDTYTGAHFHKGLEVMAAYFAHPWKRYEESVSSAFQPQPNLPHIPQVGQPSGLPPVAQEAAEVGTSVVNAATGLANVLPSRGVGAMLIPGAGLYAVPFFAAQTWEDAKQAFSDFGKAISGKPISAGTLSKDVLDLGVNAFGTLAGSRLPRSGKVTETATTGQPQARPTPAEPPATPKEQAEAGQTAATPEAKLEDWKASKTNPPSDYGIAARVSEERAKAGKIEEVVPGEGVTPEETIIKGRAALEAGANPFKALSDFQKSQKLSAEDIALVRAHGEELAKSADEAADTKGIESTEYKMAAQADSDWIKAIKPMQTEWHRMGEAQQGETELDTGSFHALARSYVKMTGGEFTPKQANEAQEISGKVRQATTASEQASQLVFSFLKDMPIKFADMNAQVRKVWELAKKYADEGETDYDAMRHKIATDLGVPVDEVTKNLTEPKSLRKITDDMYAKLSKRREMIQDAKNWLRNEATPGWLRFVRQVPRIFFIDKIIGHGTVGMVTHAGLNAFDPGAWGDYWPAFFQQFKLLGWHDKGAYHQRMMEDLTRDPNFTLARRSGLANDPMRYTDDYQATWLQTKLQKIGLTGNRGFDALKIFRQARFNQIWGDMPASMQTADNAKLVADSVNHATGVVKMPFREWASWTFFAPKLEGSRWAWMGGDTLKAGKTFANWDKASSGEQAFAIRELKTKAQIAGTYLGLLALNQGLLSATGSRQQINFTDPRKGDFLAFKAGGYKFQILGPMLGMVRLFANLVHDAFGKRKGLEKVEPRYKEMGGDVAEYVRGKLSPFAADVVDVVSQSDFQGRPLPFSHDKTPAYLRKEGVKKYTVGEYAAEQFSPIPASEAIKEVWRKQGMSESDIDHWMGAFFIAALAGGTGARMSKDMSKPKQAISDRNIDTTNR